MHLLDRIDHALRTKTVDAADFERCAQEVLGPIYPGLVPMPGGTDHGRDADIPADDGQPRIRLMVTRARTLKGARSNMVGGIKSLKEHGEPVEQVLLANLAELSALNRLSLKQTASNHGVEIVEIYDRVFFANQFRRDGEWRSRLLGIPGDPAAVSRLPVELAETPWARHPLAGRDAELEHLRSTEGDIVLLGVPGSGKTRLLAELADVVFVDREAAISTLADDLRMLSPVIVVVDDAGDQLELVAQLRRLRLQEPDLLSFQLILVGWPDEAERLRDVLPEAEHVELGLLERLPMDSIVKSMGITGILARHQILAQAEGRPGWAVALGSVLLASREPAELLSGQALLGQVGRYLRRRQLGDETADALATAAVLGFVAEAELSDFASTLGTARPTLITQLQRASRSGLLDIVTRSSPTGPARSYHVRPPMLAQALVAERLVGADLPTLDVREIYDSWVEHRGAISRAVAEAVRLGVGEARGLAIAFFDAAFVDPQVGATERLATARSIGSLDGQAAQHVLDVLRPEFDRLAAEVDANGAWRLEGCVSLAAQLARWRLDDAVRLLLDAAVLDLRPLNPHPEHPLRELGGLICALHPELPPDDEIPAFLIESAGVWLDNHRQEPRAWDVYGEVAAATLDLARVDGAFEDPGNPLSYSIHTRVATPAQIADVEDRVWPGICARLEAAPPRTVSRVIETLEQWLHLGAGYDMPFGQGHPPETLTAANTTGQRLMADLAAVVTDHPGLAARYNDVATRYELDERVHIPEEIGPFFQDIPVGVDWQQDVDNYKETIAPIVKQWTSDPPERVCRRLTDMREQFNIAGFRWPPRTDIVCELLVEEIDDTQPWLDAALATGLFPGAAPILRRHRQVGGRIATEQIEMAMGQPPARPEFAREILTDPSAQPDELAAVLDELGEGDYRLLANLVDLPDERWRLLLTDAALPARAVAGLAFAYRASFDPSWTPGSLEAEWLEAIHELPALTSARGADGQPILGYLAERYPDDFLVLFKAYWVGDPGAESVRRIPMEVIQAATNLDNPHKSRLLAQLDFETGPPGARWILLQYLVGTDAAWLAEAIDADLITVHEALSACGGFGARPPLEALAQVLVPRGAAPEQLAVIEQFGIGWGPMSARYTNIADGMTPLLDSDDPNVVAVANAGIDMYKRMADAEQQKERQARVRGYE